MIIRSAAVSLLLLLAACAPQGAQDDPVMEPPEGTPTAAPTEGEEPVELGDGGDADADGAAADGADEDGAWERRAEAPAALTEVAAAPFGGAVWTAGGFDADGSAVSSVLIHDPTFDGWEEGPPLPAAVHHAALVSTGEALYLIGGYTTDGFDAPTAAVVVLDPASGDWADGPALPEPRAAGAAAWDGERVVYGGGVGPDGLAEQVWALVDGGWEEVGELSEAREHLAGASDGDGRVWFLGGRTGGFDTNLAAVDLVEGAEVTRIGDLPTARGGVAGLHLPGIGGCALGGEGTDGTFAEVECIDADGGVTTLPALSVARHGLGAAVVEGTAYAVLGGPEPGLFVSDVVEALVLDDVR